MKQFFLVVFFLGANEAHFFKIGGQLETFEERAVYNGYDATKDRQLYVEMRDPESGDHICGGTAISGIGF